nr:SGNH/GDSL hydrolase family protein [Aquicoccus sp. G2-2]MEA1115105.1 SGNH/GDSL hydrolase family protein [Aquicoccus sp. G2-2]
MILRRLLHLALLLAMTALPPAASAAGKTTQKQAPKTAAISKPEPRILIMGDSLLASHSISGRSIGDVLERLLHEPVKDRSVVGARMLYFLPVTGALGLSIPKQWRKAKWDWVILNGGGNDLWLGCGCQDHDCDHKMNRLIAKSGRRGRFPRWSRKSVNPARG